MVKALIFILWLAIAVAVLFIVAMVLVMVLGEDLRDIYNNSNINNEQDGNIQE